MLVAAAGGGIRAAWWTVQALDKLAATPCRQHAVFAASGVSGGSLGLAIMATTAERGMALTRIAGPDALAAAIDGVLLRDTIAGMTGADLTAAGMPAGQRFPDRAALLEHAWESEDPGLARPFPLRRPALPWLLMFNSTAVGTGCRAVIAERSPTATTSLPRCPAWPASTPPPRRCCPHGSPTSPRPEWSLAAARLPPSRSSSTWTADTRTARAWRRWPDWHLA